MSARDIRVRRQGSGNSGADASVVRRHNRRFPANPPPVQPPRPSLATVPAGQAKASVDAESGPRLVVNGNVVLKSGLGGKLRG